MSAPGFNALTLNHSTSSYYIAVHCDIYLGFHWFQKLTVAQKEIATTSTKLGAWIGVRQPLHDHFQSV